LSEALGSVTTGNPEQVAQPAGDDTWAAALGDKAGEYRDLVAAKGWKGPADALASYKSLEGLLGANRVVVPGKDAKPEEWDALWNKLGRPEKPDAYQFNKPDDASGYDDGFLGWARGAFHQAGLTGRQAAALHDAYLGWFGEQTRAQQTAQAEAMKAAGVLTGDAYSTALRDSFGDKSEETVALAARAAKAIGLDQAKMSAIESAVGSIEMIRLLGEIGGRMSEDRLAAATGTGVNPADEIKTLEADEAFMKAYLDGGHVGHQAAVEKLTSLYGRMR